MSQLFRFGLVGVASNAGAYTAYLLITTLGVSPKSSMTIVYVAGATVGFLGNRTLTFAHQGSVMGAGIRYVIAHSFGYGLNLSILIVMVGKLGYAHQLVQAFAILVVAAFLFLAFKFFAFANDEVAPAEEQ